MKHTKEQKASYLLDEIGGVRDILLEEALTYRPRKKSYAWILPVSVAATAMGSVAAVLLAVLISLPILWNLVQPDKGNAQEPPNADGNAPVVEAPTLNSVLTDAVAYRTPASSDEIDYFAGVTLVWERNDGTLAESRPLTRAETTRLLSLIGQGTPVGEQSPGEILRVWLVMGDGTVITPHLPITPGNTASATLFDYQAELLPSEELISCISDILGQQGS